MYHHVSRLRPRALRLHLRLPPPPDSAPALRPTGPEAGVEWPTLIAILGVTGAWMALTASAGALGLWLTLPALALCLTLHSSLCHEVLHGHPTPNQTLNALLVFPAIGLFVPYLSFRDQHLAHHRDESLTDPYDDPESNFLDPAVWHRLSWPAQQLLKANNTLLGRMLLGPAISLVTFWRGQLRALRSGDRRAALAWALHVAGLLPVAAWLWTAGSISPLTYAAAAYAALGILKIRTFAEHRAHERARGRSVIIEDRGPLAWLFLNNNLHAVHHAHPGLAWYHLPAFYRARPDRFLEMNGHYRFPSYGALFRAHALRRKDPVQHPLMPEPR